MVELATADADARLTAGLAEDLDGTFEALVRAHQDRLFTIALRTGGDRHDAEELVQDPSSGPTARSPRRPPARIRDLRLRGWLTTILLNAGRNRARVRRVPTTELAFDPGAEPADDPLARPTTARPGRRLLAGLSPAQRTPSSSAMSTGCRTPRSPRRSAGPRNRQGPRPSRTRRPAHSAPRRRAARARGDPRMTDPIDPATEAALAGLAGPRRPPGWPIATLVAVGLADDYASSSRRSARSGSPGTAAASPRSAGRPTTRRSRRASTPGRGRVGARARRAAGGPGPEDRAATGRRSPQPDRPRPARLDRRSSRRSG